MTSNLSSTLSGSDSDEDGPVVKRPRFGGSDFNKAQSSMKKPQHGNPEVNPAQPSSVQKGSGLYNEFASKMMAKMGYKEGTGLGKNAQGRVSIVEASQQRGRRGLGLTIRGLEPSTDVQWSEEDDELILDETVEWIPSCKDPVPDINQLRTWKVVGPKKRTLEDETHFCSSETLTDVLSCKSIFDSLEPEEMRRARTKSNPYETIRGVFFLNRAAMKMANMDAILDFMFTRPKYSNGKPMVGPSDLLYFADVCAGPGGFSEYVLWRSKAEAKGFGMTLKGPCDFKLEDFFAGPPEMFEPHYGVGGVNGDGDIFNPENQKAFIDFVKQNTDGQGVHFMMADGGFSVEGQENIQEILSKQLYLCQFLVAISILRTGGHFVCKLFDLFTQFSVGLVYLMYRIFEHVTIIKPVTSRPANSERYIVCKGLRADFEPVRQYMHEINLDLNKYMSDTSVEDINEIVPLNFLQNNDAFYEYICNSNDILGALQITGLRKIKAFTQNSDLYESRQADVRTKLLKKWKVDDEVRKAPARTNPQSKFEELVQNEQDLYDHVTDMLTLSTMKDKIQSAFDFRCVVTGESPDKRVYILSLGRSHVFRRQCHVGARWQKMDSGTGMRLELPRDTLIEAEIVTELRGEGTGQRKMVTIHALDAMFLFGRDVRKLHFNERIQKLQKFVKSITKTTRSDLMKLVVPEVFRLEEISRVFDSLEMKRVKGGGGGDKLCYCPKDLPDHRFFQPAGVYIIKTIKDPWTMNWSKSQQKKYFFHKKTRESLFECPADSIASARDTKLHSCMWSWSGVKLLDNQSCHEDPSQLSKDNLMVHLHSFLPSLPHR